MEARIRIKEYMKIFRCSSFSNKICTEESHSNSLLIAVRNIYLWAVLRIRDPVHKSVFAYKILSSYWLAHFYLTKNLPKCCSILGLGWIAGCWNSLFTSHNPKNNWCLFHFWSTVQRKRSKFEHMQTVIQTSRRLDSFLYEAPQNFELKYSRSKIKNKKPIVVDVLLMNDLL
jgi:hypothetical protein